MASILSSQPASSEESPSRASDPPERSVIKEVLAVLAIVVFADISLYRGHGYTGVAAFLIVAAGLLALGLSLRRGHRCLWILGGMLLLVSTRLVWFGSPLLVSVGCAWLLAFVAALHGQVPYFVNVLAVASQTVGAGGRALWEYLGTLRGSGPRWHRRRSLTVVLPALAFFVFGTLFILANPDAVTFIGRRLQHLLDAVSDWFVEIALRPTEILFWFVVAWIAAGLLRPILHLPPAAAGPRKGDDEKPAEAPLYAAFRNTLLTVIGLFGVYLIYEFFSLWTRDFPEGFYYAGYAHEGAAWLTAALGLATLTLSLVFSQGVRRDRRLPKLRSLAWIWTVQNLLLSLAVYNRLFIYIDYNGMTWMRVVGLFGISLVIVGFLLVVWKIAQDKDFLWLIQRQIWAVCVAVYLFALLPIDALAAGYNVRRILDGELSASMQIGVQELDLEGVTALVPLLECTTPEIREGAAALIAGSQLKLGRSQSERQAAGWTAYQGAHRRAMRRFAAVRGRWQQYLDPQERRAATQRLYHFAYQWY